MLTDLCSVSPLGARLHNVDPADAAVGLPTKAYRAHLHEEDVARIEREWERSHDGTPFEQVYRVQRPEGGYRVISAQGRPVLGRDGKPLRCIGLLAEVNVTAYAGAFAEVSDGTSFDVVADCLLAAAQAAKATDDRVLIALCETALRRAAQGIIKEGGGSSLAF